MYEKKGVTYHRVSSAIVKIRYRLYVSIRTHVPSTFPLPLYLPSYPSLPPSQEAKELIWRY